MSCYERHMIVEIEDGLSIIGETRKIKVGDVYIRLNSNRLICFKRSGLTCKHCGVVAKFFAVERHKKTYLENSRPHKEKDCQGWHLNLYGINKYGDEVLMTADHIIPKSRGGKNNVKNLQTLCTKCNHKKENKLEEELHGCE